MDASLGKLQELVIHREAWRATVHGVTKSRIRQSDWTELKVYILMNLDICIRLLHHHYNQGNKHTHHLQKISCVSFDSFFFFLGLNTFIDQNRNHYNQHIFANEK